MVRFRYFSVLVGLLFWVGSFAQQATVTAKNYDISDNLDLQAVASVFGDSKDLADFEFRLNDPEMRLSNLDLNRDGYVDYLRVIEAVEGRTHLIVIQAVLGQDVFQDVATIEVEKDRRNQVQVQVVGNSYIYGNNYIYEPIYVHTPSMFSLFWTNSYRPYYSSWYWNYYPTYFNYWQPYPVYTYVNHVHVHVNRNNRYVYVNNRRSSRAVRMHREVRSNAYERDYPQNSFSNRNNNVSNRYVLQQSRGVESGRTVSSNRVQGVSSGRNVNAVNRETVNYKRGAATTGRTLESSSRTSSTRATNATSARVQNANSTINSTRSSSSSSNRVSAPRATSTTARATNTNSSRSNMSSQPARIQRTSAPTSRPASTMSRSSNTNFSSGRTSAPSSRSSSSMNTSSRGGGNTSSRSSR